MKKVLSLLFAVAIVFSMATVSFAAYDFKLSQDFIDDETFVLGDVNGDGAVNAVDSYCVKTTIAGVCTEEISLDAADFDANGQCSAPDSYSLKLCLAGAKTTSDFENGKQVYKLTIGGNDISEYSIVLNEGITDEDNSYVSALLLKKYLSQLVGVDLPVCYGAPAGERAIYIDQLDLFSEEGQKYGVEGLRYEVKGGDLYIIGTLRGTMYSVYEILEKYLGVRFFSNDATLVYKARAVDIPEGTAEEIHPKITFRVARHTFGASGALNYYLANKLNGDYIGSYDSKRYGTLSGPIYSNAHSMYEYWRMGTGTYPENTEGMTESQILEAKFASGTIPDAYGWQPCATDKTVYDTLFQGMLECNRMGILWGNTPFIEEGVTVFSFSILDNQYYCTCRNCTKISRVEGFSGLYLSLYNKAAVDVQAYYPGVRLMGIIYAKDFPKTIKPDENIILLYCGIGCDNHILGMEECYEKGGQLNGMNNDNDIEALNFWGDLCAESDAELWFWIYPVTYHYYLCGCPNIPNLYYNTKYLMDECNVTGIFYEGGGRTYNFETLKAYASVQLMWDTDMTYEEYCEMVKEYLYMYYGEGYEELFRYILMQTEAGDRCGTCFINNYDRPGDMYSYEYLAENYGEMRGLLETALEKAKTSEQRARIETLLVCCDFMGLSSVHTDWYVNGNNVELYCERYDWMLGYIKSHNMVTFSEQNLYPVPAVTDYTVNPMIQFYESGSRRLGIYP
ncbi:MAG: DUF4838 domain-containing protein [Ruminococcaceae bacterium]|nr:DUF4838 domain-containing protein [Oscillospiraceae bacterium]